MLCRARYQPAGSHPGNYVPSNPPKIWTSWSDLTALFGAEPATSQPAATPQAEPRRSAMPMLPPRRATASRPSAPAQPQAQSTVSHAVGLMRPTSGGACHCKAVQPQARSMLVQHLRGSMRSIKATASRPSAPPQPQAQSIASCTAATGQHISGLGCLCKPVQPQAW